MLVKHFLRRRNDDAMVPVDTHVIALFAFIPKQGIAVAVDGKDVGAARMAMRLFVSARYDLGCVAAQRPIGENPAQARRIFAAGGPAFKLKIGYVRDEIGFAALAAARLSRLRRRNSRLDPAVREKSWGYRR